MNTPMNIASILCIVLLIYLNAIIAFKRNDVEKEDERKLQQKDESDEPREKVVVIEIQEYENVYFTDCFDENYIIAIKENDTLDKSSFEELSEHYPRSIYAFDVGTKTYALLLEQENVNLGGAALSPNHNYMLYSVSTLENYSYYIYHMNSKEKYLISNNVIGSAMGAKWVQGDEIIGAINLGGIYMGDTTGNIRLLEGITDDMIDLVEKVGNQIFYKVNSNPMLLSYHLESGEKKSLPFGHVKDILPSFLFDQLLIIDSDETGMTLFRYDLEKESKQELAKGFHIDGMAWSPTGEMISYLLMPEEKEGVGCELYIKDLMMNQTKKIVEGIQYGTTFWDTTGDKLIFTSWDGEKRDSIIVLLERK